MLSFREEVNTPTLTLGVPTIAGFWGSFDNSQGHVFYEEIQSSDLSQGSYVIAQSFGNNFDATYGFYATWDRLSSSLFTGVCII